MRRKVVITAALLHNPPVVFFDEPLDGSGQAELALEGHFGLAQPVNVLLDIQELLRGQQTKLTEIAENVQLSDATKSIARREKERKALHEAIQDETLRGNWDAAYYLVDELEKRFGYRAEAAKLREEIDTWRGRAKEQRLLCSIRKKSKLSSTM